VTGERRRWHEASIGSPTAAAYSRIFFGWPDDVKPDGQGRLTIPLRLRQQVGIEREPW